MQIPWGPTPHGCGRSGAREAGVEVAEELRQEGIGRRATSDLPQPQLADQAILQGAPEPLNAALALRRAGLDVADAQLLEDAAEMSGRLDPGELLLEGPVPIGADEDVDAIAIEGHGQAAGGEDLVQQRSVAVEVFGRPEVQGDDRGRRIIDGPKQ